MTRVDLTTAAADGAVTTASADLRVAGRAALVAAIAWLAYPIGFVATLLNPANMDPDQTLAQWRDAGMVLGYVVAVAGIVFGIALGMMIFAADRARAVDGYSARLAHGLGLLAAAAMVVAGGIDLMENSLAGSALTMIPDASEGARWLAHQSIGVVHEGLRFTACLGFAVWLWSLARTRRADRVLGRASAVALLVMAVLILVPGAATGLLTGMNFVLVALIILAVVFLRRAQRIAESAQA